MLVKHIKEDEGEEVKHQESRYIKMVKAIFKVCKRQHIPLYSSRYSRKDFTIWQHIALIALMQRIRKSYREYTYDFLAIADRLLEAIGLTKKDTTLYNYREIHAEGSFYSTGKGARRVHSSYKDKEAVICTRLFRIFLAPCFPILCFEDKERCTIIYEEAGEDEGVERTNE